ncbi:MAG TPA: hypothetical protein VIF15_08240 [Polyangiaceae bacterium]|jgi:hypothetical protein
MNRVQPRHAARLDGLAGLAGALLGLPALVLPWPPSSDLALHEGMVALLVRRGDAAFAPAGLYELSLGHANQLFYAVACPLALVAGTALACKLVLWATMAVTIVFAARLADHLGRTRWAALAVAPAVLGWAFYWGYAPQMMGLALWLGVLPLLDRATREEAGARDVVLASLAMPLLGLAHATSMLCAALATTVFALVRPIERRTPLRLVPALVGVGLAFAETRWEAHDSTALARVFASRVLWHPVGGKLRGLAANVMGAHGLLAEATLALLVFVAAALWRLPEGDQAREPAGGGVRAALARHRFAVVAGALFAAYLAAPYSVNFGAFLYVRFLAPAFALAVLSLAPPRGARGPLVYAPAVALAVVPVLAALPQLAAARRHSAAVEPLIARVDEGSAVAVLHFGKSDRSLLFNPMSFGNRVLAERGGRLLLSFSEYPIAPVVVRPEARWDSTALRLAAQPGALRPAHDLRRLRWLLVQIHDGALAPRVVRALSPEGELVGASGEWLLFRSTLPALPITAPDAEPPPTAETLQERVNRLLADGG